MITFGSAYKVQTANERQQTALHNRLNRMSADNDPIEPILKDDNGLTILMGSDAKLYQALMSTLRETYPYNREYFAENLSRLEEALSNKAPCINLIA